MKLLSLKVEHFRCVRKAEVKFGPGLNVLHGPNDLGKSSLAHAIRAALLLQTTAKEHEEFLNWDGSGEPHVELVFESEPQRIWRVRKTFGSSGKAFLDESRDGIDFRQETRGREVDGRLSEILRWGLAPPGGKGRPKGMPMTFLSTALLAEQDRVNAIFETSLGQDSDESGKKLLVNALQAMAEDPRFRAVLARVQEHVDRAFNRSGNKRIAKDSPWVQLRDDIKNKSESAAKLLQELHKTSALETELQRLLERQLLCREAVARAESSVASLQEGLERTRQRQEAQARLTAIQQELREVADADRRQADLLRQVESRSKQMQAAEAALVSARAQVESARQELARVQSADRVRERELERSKLQTRLAELRSESGAQQADLQRIREVELAHEKFRTVELEARALAKSLPELRSKLEKARQAAHTAGEQERELRTIGYWLRWNAARTDLDQAVRGQAQVNKLREDADRHRATAARLEASQPAFVLPSAAQLETLRKLDQRRRAAAAQLEVGLSVVIRPKRAMQVQVHRDAEEATEHALQDQTFEIEATRKIRIEIAEVAEIEFAGGAETARQELDQVERRWVAEAEPVLQSAQAKTVEELSVLVSDAGRRATEIREARRAAEHLEERIGDQPHWEGLLAERQEHLAAAAKTLGDADTAKLEKAARKLGISEVVDVEKRLELLRAKLGVLAKEENQAASEVRIAEERESEKQRALDATREERDRAQSLIPGDWQEALRAIQARQQAIQQEARQIEAELARSADADTQSAAAAQATLAKFDSALRAAEAAHKAALEQFDAARHAHAIGEGELKSRREAAAKLDEAGARAAVQQIEMPTTPVSPEMLAQARVDLDSACSNLKYVENEIQSKRGALQQVGGEVARQRSEDADKDLEAARKREHETEMEYRAWDLLRQTLREAEKEEGAHLGRTLADPIARRMGDLTGGRYGKIDLGPNLEAKRIHVAGDNRSLDLLSVGTREQLSTIFRLTLAEQLQSTVLLDDQLTQTDARRMAWLLQLIRQVAANIQVIVFTCRPEEYLGPITSAGAAVHAVDLTGVVDRLGASTIISGS